MTNITTTKENALKCIYEKIDEAQIIESKLTFEISQDEYNILQNEVGIWKISTGNILKQIFSDSHLAKTFLEVGDTVMPKVEDKNGTKTVKIIKQ